MQVISVTFPKKIVVTVAVTAKHVTSADLAEILLDLDAINGEVIGTTAAEKTDKIEATKLAIETAVEAEGVTIPVDTAFADYPDYVALIPGAVEAAYKVSVDAVNGEPSADLTAGIALTASTKLVIETAIETAGVVVPAETLFADYANYIIEAIFSMLLTFNDETGAITSYNATIGPRAVVIPSSIGGVPVVSVTGLASKYLTAFRALNGLETIDTSGVRDNTELATVEIPSDMTIGMYAFFGCPITKIVIGSGDTIIVDSVNYQFPTMGTHGRGFEALYNGNGKLAGIYEYAAGTWSKTA